MRGKSRAVTRAGVFSNSVKKLSPGREAGQAGMFSKFYLRGKSRGDSRNKGRNPGTGEILNLQVGI